MRTAPHDSTVRDSRPLRRPARPGLILIAALSLTGCLAPFQMRGQVIDEETGAPVSGALVEVAREHTCFPAGPFLPGDITRHVKARTGADGRFTVRVILGSAPCLFLALAYETAIRVVAPGYHPWTGQQKNTTQDETIALSRLQWQSELDAYRENRVTPAGAAVSRMRARPVDDEGVAARIPGAALDRVAVVTVSGRLAGDASYSAVLLVRDGKTGRIHGLDEGGRAVALGLPTETGWTAVVQGRLQEGFLLFRRGELALPTGPFALTWYRRGADSSAMLAVGEWQSRPGLLGAAVKVDSVGNSGFLATDETGAVLWLPTQGLHRQPVRAGEVISSPLPTLIPEATGPVECVMRSSGNFSGILLLVPVREGRGLFVLETPGSRIPTPTRLATHPLRPVVACARRDSVVYFVHGDRITRGVLDVESRSPRYVLHAFREGPEFFLPSGVPPAVDLAVRDVPGGLVLYAVNGTDTVYRLREAGGPDVWRFLLRGADQQPPPRPDQRIAVEWEESAPTAAIPLSPGARPSSAPKSVERKELGSLWHSRVFRVAFSPDSRTLATMNSEGVKLWDVASSGGLVERVVIPARHANGMVFSPDGRWLATAGHLNGLAVWNTTTGQRHPTILSSSEDVLAFSPDGKILATNKEWWDIDRGRVLAFPQGYTEDQGWAPDAAGPIFRLAFSADGKTILSIVSSAPRTRRGPHGERPVVRWSVPEGRYIEALGNRDDVGWQSALAPGARVVAVAHSHRDHRLRFWEIETGRRWATLSAHPTAVTALAFSSDGASLVSGGHDGTVKVWRVETGEEIVQAPFHGVDVKGVALSADGSMVASCTDSACSVTLLRRRGG